MSPQEHYDWFHKFCEPSENWSQAEWSHQNWYSFPHHWNFIHFLSWKCEETVQYVFNMSILYMKSLSCFMFIKAVIPFILKC